MKVMDSTQGEVNSTDSKSGDVSRSPFLDKSNSTNCGEFRAASSPCYLSAWTKAPEGAERPNDRYTHARSSAEHVTSYVFDIGQKASFSK